MRFSYCDKSRGISIELVHLIEILRGGNMLSGLIADHNDAGAT